MKKILTLFIISLIFLIIILNGCLSNKSNKEKILGSWLSEESAGEDENAVFNFFSNQSFSLVVNIYFNESDENLTTLTFWETYTINDEVIIMKIEGKDEILEYYFSEGDDVLTLIEDNGEETVLLRK